MRQNMTAWVISKGPDLLRRLYHLKDAGFDRAGDSAVADALSAIALLEGQRPVTAAVVGKARGELGLVNYRSKRGAVPASAEPQPPVAQLRILPAPEPATAPDPALLSRLGRESVAGDERIAAALESKAKAAWAQRDQLERIADALTEAVAVAQGEAARAAAGGVR